PNSRVSSRTCLTKLTADFSSFAMGQTIPSESADRARTARPLDRVVSAMDDFWLPGIYVVRFYLTVDRLDWIALLLATGIVSFMILVPPAVGLADNGDFVKI